SSTTLFTAGSGVNRRRSIRGRPRRWSGALLLPRRHSITSVASSRWFITIRTSTALRDRVETTLCRLHRSRFTQKATKHKGLNSRSYGNDGSTSGNQENRKAANRFRQWWLAPASSGGG